MKNKIWFLIILSTAFILLCSCGHDPIVGKWRSDYDGATVIEFRKDSTMTVTSHDGSAIDGIYERAEEHISIKLYADGFTDSITAACEVNNNKLKLIRSDGQIEQFSRK